MIQLHDITKSYPLGKEQLTVLKGITLTIKKGEFFLALSGPNFSGSDFVKDALKKGATGAIAENVAMSEAGHGKVLIKVKNGTKALQEIAVISGKLNQGLRKGAVQLHDQIMGMAQIYL